MKNRYIFFEKNPKMKRDDHIILAVMTFVFLCDVISKILIYCNLIEVNYNYAFLSNLIIISFIVIYVISISIYSINRNVFDCDKFPRLMNIIFIILICLLIIIWFFPDVESAKIEDIIYGQYDFGIYYSIEYPLLIVGMFGFLHYSILLVRVLIGIAHHKITGA